MMHASRGMTLIETLVALTLLALLSIGLITTFRVAQHTFRSITTQDSMGWEITTAQRSLRQLLESAYPQVPRSERQETWGLEGTPSELIFLAPAPQSTGYVTRFRYRVSATGAPHQDLRIEWTSASGAALRAESGSETLLHNIGNLSLRYLRPPDLARNETSPVWVDVWTQSTHPPLLVSVRISPESSMAQYWPELLVAPKTTDPSLCSFDTVSQQCRDSL